MPHRPFSQGFKDELPYVFAHVQLDGADGQVVLIANLVGCPWTDVRVGMLVEAFFEDATDTISLPKFRPR